MKEVARLFFLALNGCLTSAQLNKELKIAAPAGTTLGSLYVAPGYNVLPVLQ
jgi:hypothetical protein